MALKKKDKQDLIHKIEYEGFEYAMVHYSDWEDIKDPEFHHLLSTFINARTELVNYIGCEDV